MNREIKFRAWDGRIMMYQDDYQEGNNDWNVSSLFEYNDGCAFMQYTELKDANGVDVYEGDKDRFGRVCEYFKNLGSFGFKHPNYAAITFLGQWVKNGGQVIGNIYENTELLTPKS